LVFGLHLHILTGEQVHLLLERILFLDEDFAELEGLLNIFGSLEIRVKFQFLNLKELLNLLGDALDEIILQPLGLHEGVLPFLVLIVLEVEQIDVDPLALMERVNALLDELVRVVVFGVLPELNYQD